MTGIPAPDTAFINEAAANVYHGYLESENTCLKNFLTTTSSLPDPETQKNR